MPQTVEISPYTVTVTTDGAAVVYQVISTVTAVSPPVPPVPPPPIPPPPIPPPPVPPVAVDTSDPRVTYDGQYITTPTDKIPVPADSLKIASGQTMLVQSVDDTRNGAIVVEAGGTLKVARGVDTRLRCTTIFVLPGGTFDQGTESDPITANKAEIIFNDVPLDTVNDPQQYGNGLICLGTHTLKGLARTSWLRLAAEPQAGDTTLMLESAPVGWEAGDRLILPDSRQWTVDITDVQDEHLTIASVSGNVITLAAPLQFKHPRILNIDGSTHALPHVGKLTSNVVIRSENVNGTRGHCLYTCRAWVDIDGGQFGGLGRTKNSPISATNLMGRHPVHFHNLLGPKVVPAGKAQFNFRNSVVSCPLTPMPFRWGITIHNSCDGNVSDNVLNNWAGSGIYTQSGNEIRNRIERNLVVRVSGTGDRGDGRLGNNPKETGFEGVGIWQRAPGNFVNGNVVYGCKAYGYHIFAEQAGVVNVPSAAGSETTVTYDPRRSPIAEFNGNEVWNCTVGMSLWSLGATYTEFYDVPTSTITGFRFYGCGKGVYLYPVRNFVLDSWVGRGSLKANGGTTGIFANDYLVSNMIVRSPDFEGLGTGIAVPVKVGDKRATGATPQPFMVENPHLRCNTNFYVETPWAVTGGGGNLAPRQTVISNPDMVPASATGNNVRMKYVIDRGNQNAIVPDQFIVNDPAGSYRAYYSEQAPEFIVPMTGSAPGLVASPEAGLTNQQNWDKYGIAIAGEVLPAAAVDRAGIGGKVVAI